MLFQADNIGDAQADIIVDSPQTSYKRENYLLIYMMKRDIRII